MYFKIVWSIMYILDDVRADPSPRDFLPTVIFQVWLGFSGVGVSN